MSSWRRPVAVLPTVVPLLAVALSVAGCTYGPPEERHRVASVFRLPDTHRVLVAVSHVRYRPPTGLSRYPDGGIPRYLRKRVVVYSGDVSVPRLTTLDTLAIPRSVWQGLDVDFVGRDGRRRSARGRRLRERRPGDRLRTAGRRRTRPPA